jgi:hypothetical protein
MEHDAKKHDHKKNGILLGVGAVVVLAFVYLSSRGGGSATPAQTVVGGPNPQEYAAALQANAANHSSDVAYATSVLQSSTALKAAALSTYQQVVPAEIQSKYNYDLGQSTILAHMHDTDVAGQVAEAGFAEAESLAVTQANAAYKIAHDQNAFAASTAVALGQQQKDTLLKQSSNQTKSSIFGSILGTVAGFFTNGASFTNPFSRRTPPASDFSGPNLTPNALSVGATPPPFVNFPLPQLQLPGTGGPYFGTTFP